MIYWLKIIGLNAFWVWASFVAWLYVPTAVGKVIAILLISFALFHYWIKWRNQHLETKQS